MRSKAFFAALFAGLAGAASAEPALNPDVAPETLSETICRTGYTRSLRPSSSFVRGIKRRLLAEAGADPDLTSGVRLDHVVPLSLGGHPRALSNLVLQITPEAARKDCLERRLKRLVCTGRLDLATARADIAGDWTAALVRYAPRCGRRHRHALVKEQNAN